MAKNLKPCNFIVTVGGKKVSMPYDEMRKYLLENPEVWMPSSTRKIGAGKAQDLADINKILKEANVERGLNYEDGEEGMYSDKYVNGQIRIVDNDVEILDWNSNESGKGNTEKSLKILKNKYKGEIRAVDVGYEGEPSYSYWQKMLDKGLINGFYDDNSDYHDEKSPDFKKTLGAGKAQALLGERGPLSSIEATAKALDGLSQNIFDSIAASYHGYSYERTEGVDYEMPEGERGIGWFAVNKKYAEGYTGKDGRVLKKFVDIKKPFVLSIAPEKKITGKEFQEITGVKIKHPFNDKEVEAYNFYDPTYTDFLIQIEDNGYDGLVTTEYGKEKSILPLSQEQIKEYTAEVVSEAYHKAKKDGTNPELVKAVEEALGAGKAQASLGGRANVEIDEIVAKAKENDTYLKAPNGKRTNLNELQWAQVRTKNFKNWFGDWEKDPENASKILDENGEPQVLYTGTSKDKDFDKFNIPDNGAWFTVDPIEASMYAKENDSMNARFNPDTGKYEDKNTASRVIPVFLNIRRPEFFNKMVTEEQREKLRYSPNYKKLQKQYFQDIYYRNPREERTDGLYYSDNKQVVVVLQDPNQIKSAIGNMGEFSPINPRIQFSRGGRGDLNEAKIKVGEAYRANAGQQKSMQVGIDYLVSKGWTPEEAYEDLEAFFLSRLQNVDVSGIKIDLLPPAIQDMYVDRTTTMEDLLAAGKEAVDSGSFNPESVAFNIANGYDRPLHPVEVAAFVYYKRQLDDRIKRNLAAIEALQEKEGAEKELYDLETTRIKLQNELENYHIMSRKTGYEQGLAFRARQMLLDTAYTLAGAISKYKVLYKYIPDSVRKRFTELDKRMKEIEKKELELEKRMKEYEENRAKANFDKMARESKTDTGKQRSAMEEISYIARNLRDKVSKELPTIFGGVFGGKKTSGQKSEGGRDGDVSDPQYVFQEAVDRAAIFLQDKKKASKEEIDAAVKEGQKYIQSTKWYKGLDDASQKEALSEYAKYVKRNSKPPEVSVNNSTIKIPHKVIRSYVEQGITDIDKIAEAIIRDFGAELKEQANKDVTVRDIRDAITKYGVTSYPDPDEIETAIREAKAAGLKISQIEDLLQGKRPLKSGYQRDPMSPEIREKQKQVNELLKSLELNEEESAAYLKTALDRIKKSLQNQIEDLEAQIKAGERKVVEKKKIEYDAEVLALKQKREDLKKALDELVGPSQIPLEQKLNRAIAAVERSILEYRRRIAEKDFSSNPRERETYEGLPDSQKYKDALEERKKLQDELKALKKGPEKTKEEKEIERLEKELDDLLSGTYTPQTPPQKLDSPRIKALRDQISDLKKQMGFKKTEEDVKIERLRKKLADIVSGAATPSRRTVGPDSPEALALRDQIELEKKQRGIKMAEEIQKRVNQKELALKAINDRIDTIIRTGKDKEKGPEYTSARIEAIKDQIKDRQEVLKEILEQYGIAEQKRLAALKKRINTYIEEKQERIRTKNFNPKPKLKTTLDDEAKNLLIEQEKIKEEYEVEFFKAELDQRSNAQKTFDVLLDAWDASKTAVSGLDMSAPLRQGFIEVMTQNPITTLKALRFMFQSTFDVLANDKNSAENYEKWLAGIKMTEEYRILKKMGLYLAETNAKTKAAEDNFANRLLHHIPLYQKPITIGGKKYTLDILGKSERAYTSFLNYMRWAAATEVLNTWKDLDIPITPESNPEEYKAMMELINVSTGRPNLGGFESSANIINKMIFSIRLVASRWMFVFLPLKAPFMPPAARKLALIKYARFWGSMALLHGLLALWLNNDDDDETEVYIDPRSPKFMDIKINDKTSINLTAGLSSVISLMARLGTQKYKKVSTGEVRNLGQDMYDPTFISTSGEYVAGKASPSARIFLEYAMSQEDKDDPSIRYNAYGERYSLAESLGALGIPLVLQDISSINEANKAYTAAGLATMAFFGGQVKVRGEAYKSASERMKEAIMPMSAEARKTRAILDVRLKDPDESAENVQKPFNKLVEMEKSQIPNAEQRWDDVISDRGNTLEEAVKFDISNGIWESMTTDKLAKKNGFDDTTYRTMFFRIMAGEKPFGPIPAGTPENQIPAINKARIELLNKFTQIPQEDKDQIAKEYGIQYDRTVQLAKNFNKLNIRFNMAKKDWNRDIPFIDWVNDYMVYRNSPKYKKPE